MPKKNKITLEDFYQMQEEAEDILEYIDGIVFMTPSPTTKHQRIVMRLGSEIHHFLKGKGCEIFSAPFDIYLGKDDVHEGKIVVPDLVVICDKEGLDEKKYTGVPSMIVEVLSPSNQSHDLVTKMNLYMQYGVKEYWIINPMLNVVQIYLLNDEKQYIQVEVQKGSGEVSSSILEGFKIDIENLFK